MSAYSAVGFEKNVRVHMEVEFFERVHPGRGVRVGDDEVRTEGEEAADH